MKEWKAPEKEAQKMTRDGAVSVNLVTRETTYPSDRTPEQDYSASGDTAGAAGKAVDRAELHREQAAAKKKRRKQRRTYREGEAAAGRPSSRLQFSEADQVKPELQGAIRKSDKAADRLDAAKAAVPSKTPSPHHANPLSRPIREAGAAIHGKVREVEQENSGVQSGHLGERSFEKAVGYSHISEDGQKLFQPEKETVGICPRCGKPVYEGKKNFACSDRACQFVMWKNDRFWTSRRKEITRKMAVDLLKKGRTSVKGMWSEKKGSTYDAVVSLDDTGGKYVNFKLEFPKRKDGVHGKK